MCSGRPEPTSSVVNRRRKSCGVNRTGPPASRMTAHSAVPPSMVRTKNGERTSWRAPSPAGEQMRKGFAVGLLVRVVAHRERDLIGAVLGAPLDCQKHGDQFWADWDEPLDVGLERDDVQQWQSPETVETSVGVIL